jgi:uncharacterized membrane protein
MPAEDKSRVEVSSGVERLVSLTDNVFAFSITLLVLDLVVPVLSSGASSADLWAALSTQYNSFVAYLISFLIAGAWWNAHHRTFAYVRRTDTTLRWLNLLFLLWITLLPFFTKILSGYISLQLALVLYAVDQAAAGFFITLSWWYASRNHRLVDKSLMDNTIRGMLFWDAFMVFWFIFSIFVSFVDPSITLYVLLGIFPLHAVANRLTGNR